MQPPEKIDHTVITDRLNTIQKSIRRLKELQTLSVGAFMLDDNFAIAEHNLRYALEATFDICSHILARILGTDLSEYKIVVTEMARHHILPLAFMEQTLVPMAGYRNRLAHFYFEISPKEMYDIIQHQLGDFEMFMGYIKTYLEKSS